MIPLLAVQLMFLNGSTPTPLCGCIDKILPERGCGIDYKSILMFAKKS